MKDVIVIGVDHGYAAMKTVHFSFPTGLVEYEHEPYTQKDVLEYNGRYYVVGSGRQPLQRDKTQTEDYYLLTLAAIAKELEHRGAEHTASVHLAAGLPLTSFGRDKKSFRSYLYRDGSAIPFRYEGQDYTVTIQEVSLFPQGYAAVLTQTELLDEPSVIVADIGGWTVDLMRLDNRIPNAASCRSLELGMIRCIDEISEQVRRLFGLSLTTAQIESALRGSSGGMDERIRAVIHTQAGKYARNLLSAVTESGLDIRAMPAIFLGGGAALLKRHLSATDGLCRPLILDDVSLNAKGYERLVGQMSRGVGMADKRRLNLSFSLTSPQQREAWRILSSIPVGQRTDTVCRMVCKAHEQDALLSAIRGLIREELRHLDLTTEKSRQAQAGDMDENVLGFLLALQQEGDEIT